MLRATRKMLDAFTIFWSKKFSIIDVCMYFITEKDFFSGGWETPLLFIDWPVTEVRYFLILFLVWEKFWTLALILHGVQHCSVSEYGSLPANSSKENGNVIGKRKKNHKISAWEEPSKSYFFNIKSLYFCWKKKKPQLCWSLSRLSDYRIYFLLHGGRRKYFFFMLPP